MGIREDMLNGHYGGVPEDVIKNFKNIDTVAVNIDDIVKLEGHITSGKLDNVDVLLSKDPNLDNVTVVGDGFNDVLKISNALSDGTFTNVDIVVAEPFKTHIGLVAGIRDTIVNNIVDIQNAAENANKAKEWAEKDKYVEVEKGQYSAKHWASIGQESYELCRDYADACENVIVETEQNQCGNTGWINKYSAKHWSIQANKEKEEAEAILVTIKDAIDAIEDVTDEVAAAKAAAEKAKKYAENDEDKVVENIGGVDMYSAKNYSIKAGKAEVNAINAKNDAETASTSAVSAANSATASAKTASDNATIAVNAKDDAILAKNDAGTAAQAATTAATNANGSASSASGSANTAFNYARDAGSAKDLAVDAKDDAVLAKGAAETSATNASVNEAKAEKWATEAEDTEVEIGKYSSFHWSRKSEGFLKNSHKPPEWASGSNYEKYQRVADPTDYKTYIAINDIIGSVTQPHSDSSNWGTVDGVVDVPHDNIYYVRRNGAWKNIDGSHNHDSTYEPKIADSTVDKYVFVGYADGRKVWEEIPEPTSIDWSKIQNTPTTLANYGITDVYTITQVQTKLDTKEDNLGNPTADDMVLSSKIDGTRNWINVTSAEWGNITGNIDNQTDLKTALNGKSNTGHTHTEAQITDLDKYTKSEVDTALNGKSDTNHNQYGSYAIKNHTHSGIYADKDHTHAISNVTGLQTALDGKAEASALVGVRLTGSDIEAA